MLPKLKTGATSAECRHAWLFEHSFIFLRNTFLNGQKSVGENYGTKL